MCIKHNNPILKFTILYKIGKISVQFEELDGVRSRKLSNVC
jgi:hypothetical protein